VNLSGNIDHEDGNNDLDENSYHVLIGANCTIDGLTVTGGNAVDEIGRGGGIYSFEKSVHISGCVFKGNSTEWGGGAIYVEEGSITIDKSFFNGNNFAGNGGAIFLEKCTESSITKSTFENNTVELAGGAIAYFNCSGHHSVVNSVFFSNMAVLGGAIYIDNNDYIYYKFLNCSFSKNHANHFGGGIFITQMAEPSGEIINSIFWYNSAYSASDIYEEVIGQTEVTYCDIEQTGYNTNPSNHNVMCSPYANPFTSTEMRIYPDPTCCKDNANQSKSPADDRDGNLRPVGCRDRGAYEYIP
jgi:predicted outer membrane repeat protein